MAQACFEKVQQASFLKPWSIAEAIDILCNSQYFTEHGLNVYTHTHTHSHTDIYWYLTGL